MAPKMMFPAMGREGGAAADALNASSLEELSVSAPTVEAVQAAWHSFTSTLGSAEAAGKLVLSTLFDIAPDTQSMFSGSKGAHAAKFMESMKGLVRIMGEPKGLKVAVEHLGFQHMSVEITVPRMMSFRAAVLNTLTVTLADKFTSLAQGGITQLLNYVGGALIYIRSTYGDRVRILRESWKIAKEGTGGNAAGGTRQADDEEGEGSGSFEAAMGKLKNDASGSGGAEAEEARRRGRLGRMKRFFSRRRRQIAQSDATSAATAASQARGDGQQEALEEALEEEEGASPGELMAQQTQQAMPTSFEDMFAVNAAVMGVRSSSLTWMYEVLENFDNFVAACSDQSRLQQEADVLTIRMSKYPDEIVDLKQFKACMLAALRSLLSKLWASGHEDAWGWIWDTIAVIIKDNLSKPAVYQKALDALWDGMDDNRKYEIRKDIYLSFFELAPAGQDYFKQSNTRLHFIAERVLNMSLEILERPKQMVSQISALGLRHVGFGIPTDLIPPFVVACVKVMENHARDPKVVEAFDWSLHLIAKILIRTIKEGSTVVMKAINANSVKAMKRAINTAPRRHRATYLLDVQVGDQHISPLSWSIESGSIKVARAILKDILTIRADRQRYYYGVGELWRRHPDIVKKLQEEAPTLLPTLLEGLIWRSHRTKNKMRRVNYYLENMLVKADGTFADALESISASGDPSLVSHPTVALLTDCLWSGLVVKYFITSRMWNVISLLIFILSQQLLPSWKRESDGAEYLDYMIIFCRVWNYVVGMGRLATFHLHRIWVWCRNTMRRIIREIDTDGNGEIDYEEMKEALHKFKDTVLAEAKKAIRALREDGPGTMDEAKKAIANREKNMYTMISFSLLLLLGVMCTHEPMFWCSGAEDWPTEYCETTGSPLEPKPMKYRYSIFAMTAMAVHWLILIDLAVFSTEISAFLLVCGHVLGEVKQFLIALSFLLLAFGSSISILCRNCPTDGGDFNDTFNAVISLFAITVGLYQGDFRDIQSNGLLLMAVSSFVTISVILLLNLLVAQLNRSYEYIYKDMLGFARLNRASLIVDAMESCSRKRFQKFIKSLQFDQRLEFDDGDLGISGGIASVEDSKLHVQTREPIRRFGGTTSGQAPWPEDAEDMLNMEDEEEKEAAKLERIEKLVAKILKRSNAAAARERNDASKEDSKLSSLDSSKSAELSE